MNSWSADLPNVDFAAKNVSDLTAGFVELKKLDSEREIKFKESDAEREIKFKESNAGTTKEQIMREVRLLLIRCWLVI